jgi:hypothetical protein
VLFISKLAELKNWPNSLHSLHNQYYLPKLKIFGWLWSKVRGFGRILPKLKAVIGTHSYALKTE